MTEKNVFSERLTQLREDRGLKRQEVADALEISRASLEYYEKGQRKPDIEVAARIAKYYGVSTDYLVGVSAAQVTASENETLKTVCDYLGISEASAEQVSYLTSIGYSTNMDAILSSEIIEILTTSLDDYDKKSIEKAIAYMTLSEAKTKKDKESLKEEYRQRRTERAHGIHHHGCVIRPAKHGEEASNQLEYRVPRRVSDFQFIR